VRLTLAQRRPHVFTGPYRDVYGARQFRRFVFVLRIVFHVCHYIKPACCLLHVSVARKISRSAISVLRQHSCLKASQYEKVEIFCDAHGLPPLSVAWDRPPPEPAREPGTHNAQSIADWKQRLERFGVSAHAVAALEGMMGFPPRAKYCVPGVYPRDFDFTHSNLGGESPVAQSEFIQF
jgi:hypothetical protein